MVSSCQTTGYAKTKRQKVKLLNKLFNKHSANVLLTLAK